MEELITEKELARFSQADADAVDHIFERNMNEYEINWEAAEIGRLPVLAHYYVKGEDMHYYVLAVVQVVFLSVRYWTKRRRNMRLQKKSYLETYA